jgi:hypothetical protein
VPSFRSGSSDIAKCDTPISSEPSIVSEACRKIPESRDSALRKFWCQRDRGGFAKPRIATGPTTGVCGIDRWHRVSGFGTWEVL